MGGMSTQSQQGQGQQSQQGQQSAGGNQMNAANNVKINNKQAPSMGQMQEGMGGLLTLEGMNEAFQNFISPMVNTVRNFQNEGTQQLLNQFDLNPAKTAFEQANNIEPTSQGGAFAETVAEQNAAREQDVQPQAEPELSPYEKRIRELMTNRGMSRADAVANQAHAQKLNTDNNSDGAVTNKEWALNQGADFDGDGDVTDAEWKRHMAGGKKRKPEEEEEEELNLYNTKAARQRREAKLRALSQASI